ncbi:rCG36867 [Rattus norvegicus]|uniref:RCG36867 n=1 Tax=Rattus norvegicus TaxID=10116 RepID=A6HUA8_RAT|nr:rCG36867 [Rattus norvegicus]
MCGCLCEVNLEYSRESPRTGWLVICRLSFKFLRNVQIDFCGGQTSLLSRQQCIRAPHPYIYQNSFS